MARILNLKPPCGYNVEGIESAYLLDWEDFGGYRFKDDKPYDTGLVSAIIRSAGLVQMSTPEGAKYYSSQSGKVYLHTLETFIPELSAEMSSALNLGLRRRFILVFRLRNGRYFTFGLDSGATLSYTNQTEGAVGSLVTFTARSIYPLFETTEAALTIDNAEWILTDARWGMDEYWFNSGIWNY